MCVSLCQALGDVPDVIPYHTKLQIFIIKTKLKWANNIILFVKTYNNNNTVSMIKVYLSIKINIKLFYNFILDRVINSWEVNILTCFVQVQSIITITE